MRDILRQVRKEGDAALCALTQRFDGVEVCPEQLRVSASVLAELGWADFVKMTSIIAYTPERLAHTAEHIARMAQAEGLEAHAQAVRIRQQKATPSTTAR